MRINKFNIIHKRDSKNPFIIYDMIATKLTKKQFEDIQPLNEFLKDYHFTDYEDTDFSWWVKITKKLTKTRLKSNVYFECDFYGSITEY